MNKTATVNGNSITAEELYSLARQGVKEAQLQLSEHLQLPDVKPGFRVKDAQLLLSECSELSDTEREFWAYKANGGKAFSIAAWELEKTRWSYIN